MTTIVIDEDNPLKPAEGGEAKFAIQLTSAPRARVVLSFSAPPTVTVSPTSVEIAPLMTTSPVITAMAGHDRNVVSEEAVITVTATTIEPRYSGATGAVNVTTTDDDFALSVTPTSVTENTPFASESARLVRILVQAPKGGMVNTERVMLGASGAGYTFRTATVSATGVATPYTGGEQDIAEVMPAAVGATRPGLSVAYAWLSADDDTADEDPQLIQIGETQTDEEARIEPAMITIVDADPDVTLSIDAVDEGADEVTMTITATAAGEMPGIFEIAADRWALVEDEDQETPTLESLGYAVVASGSLTIDRNQTSGTVTVTVSVPEDADKDDGMFKVAVSDAGGTVAQVVTLSPTTPRKVDVSVGQLEVTVTDNDKSDG
ncbi:hypothetical protein [Candidatus Palauibacter sp.]|uniref:hypothetical protein n=1 Tax=Candidatus Palauibacter sp. TaxID=3101350 RepID=UPI003B025FE5